MRVWVLVLVAMLAISVEAHAQPTPADRALATELFKQARELMTAGKTAEACAKFAESQRLDPGGGTLLNLGFCYEANGQLATAWTTLNEALGLARRDGRADRERLAEEHIKAIEPRLSRLTILVPAESEVSGLSVLRDGTPIAKVAWGTAMPIDPGTHQIEASAPGYETWSTTVEVTGEAASASVSVPLLVAKPVEAHEPAPTPPVAKPPRERPKNSPPPKPDTSSGETQRLLGFGALGLGVVGIGVGAFFGIRALSKQSESDDACQPECTTRGSELSREATTSADIATVSFAIGIVGLGAGSYLILSAPSGPGTAGFPSTLRIIGRF